MSSFYNKIMDYWYEKIRNSEFQILRYEVLARVPGFGFGVVKIFSHELEKSETWKDYLVPL